MIFKKLQSINIVGGMDRVIIIISAILAIIMAIKFIDPIGDSLKKENPEYSEWKKNHKELSELPTNEVIENYKKTGVMSLMSMPAYIMPPLWMVLALSILSGALVFVGAFFVLSRSVRLLIFLSHWVYRGFKQ